MRKMASTTLHITAFQLKQQIDFQEKKEKPIGHIHVPSLPTYSKQELTNKAAAAAATPSLSVAHPRSQT